jgi:hypothetical protein
VDGGAGFARKIAGGTHEPIYTPRDTRPIRLGGREAGADAKGRFRAVCHGDCGCSMFS